MRTMRSDISMVVTILSLRESNARRPQNTHCFCRPERLPE